ncbi:MAG: tRNA uridine-5-carboxymethylaminomethyl(34) synthesis GTPase MnmE [Desulfobacteraceae bacterium]|jgi:tRNA modification GTPase
MSGPHHPQGPSLEDTICAIATPPGKGGIGIVKISGPKALHLGRAVFCKKRSAIADKNVGKGSTAPLGIEYRPRHMYHGYIREALGGRPVDEVLFVYMNGPHSYTGEDVVEIHAHGGASVLETIFKMVIQQGGRCAAPGEFTQRAFINGRIDLTQAEGVMELISAKSTSAVRIAAKQVAGEFGRHIQQVRAKILGLATVIEAWIDFPDDVGPALEIDQKFAEIQREVLPGIQHLVRRHEEGRGFREGFRLALVGRPNVGKSSLLNKLSGRERAIVTEIPGTTRDLIHETVSINGASIVLTDTAGIQATENPIEKIGIEKTKNQIAASDLILLVVDAQNGLVDDEIGWFGLEDFNKLLVVINKVDLTGHSWQNRLPGAFGDLPKICVSAKTGFGMEALLGAIADRLFAGQTPNLADTVVPNFRQKEGLEKTLTHLASAVQAYQEAVPLEMVAIDLRACLTALEDILGINVRQDILECIFKEFCVGK